MLCYSTDADSSVGSNPSVDFGFGADADVPSSPLNFEQQNSNFRKRRRRRGGMVGPEEEARRKPSGDSGDSKITASVTQYTNCSGAFDDTTQRLGRRIRATIAPVPASTGAITPQSLYDATNCTTRQYRRTMQRRQRRKQSQLSSGRITALRGTPLLALSIVLLLGSLVDFSSAFHSIRQQQQQLQRQHHCPNRGQHGSIWRLPMSTATPPSSTSTTNAPALPDKTELESMKVVDLKQLIKDFGLNERGLLSKLKRKQDLIDFLAAESSSPPESPTVVVAPTPAVSSTAAQQQEQQHSNPRQHAEAQQQQPPVRKKSRITMPKKKPSSPMGSMVPPLQNGQDDHQQDQSRSSQRLSPIEVLFEKVYQQYPTLRYLNEGNSTLLGELDIRQRYHPMLQAGKLQAIPEAEDGGANDEDEDAEPTKQAFRPALSGDMDIIFVGTASCTPSITRGVSCTALRLHSLAASAGASGGNQKKKNKKNFKIESNNNKGGPQRFDVSSTSSSNLGTWLFDCGESTQLQIQKTSSVRPSKITKIFVTHAHGDHSFGLPGLLCLMGQDTAGGNESGSENVRKTKDSKPPIEIYGPEGLRLWLRTAIRYSVSRITPRYRVHELKDVAMAPEWGYSPKWEKYFFNKQAYYDLRKNGEGGSNNNQYYWGAANDRRRDALRDPRRRGQTTDWMSLCELGVPGIERSELYGEVEGGRDIYPVYDHPKSSHGAPVWEVEHEGGDIDDPENKGVKVYAAPMSHGVPCVGYVVEEADRPGRLRSELVTPICQRNIAALKEAGFRHPMKALAVIKDLPEGGSFTFPDGTVVRQEDAVEPTRPGRKIVICGDTNSARGIEGLSQGADVVIHESTNTFLEGSQGEGANFHGVNRDAIYHGHSTPFIAGDFAKRVGARRLILNHFSARYMGDQSVESISIMTRIEQQAMKASGLRRSHVAAAWDFMIFPVPKANDKTAFDEEEEARITEA